MSTPEERSWGRVASRLKRPLTIVDVGCRGGFDPLWDVLHPNVQLVGFEPDMQECRRLEQKYAGMPNFRIVPMGLGPSRQKSKLHVTADPACSSIYPPDATVVGTRPILAVAAEAGTTEIEVTTLDEWIREENSGAVDYLKVDTQGSELGVLQGAGECLSKARMLNVEVEFNPIYAGQPLFSDIDNHLRGRGFSLWRLENLVHYQLPGADSRYFRPGVQFFDSRPVQFPAEGGQLFWAEAYYIKEDFADSNSRSSAQELLRDGCLAGALGFLDLARAVGDRLAALGDYDLKMLLGAES